MPKERTAKQVYEQLSTEGLYEETHLDKEEVKKVLTMVMEDHQFGKSLCKLKDPSWRVIFNIHYDVFRELCDQLMRFERQKTSNHQGLFAFIVLYFEDLELDWSFLENIRTIRNKNKYQGLDISKLMWQNVELRFDLYISALRKEIERRIG
ncbi:MAG: hypothetical protein AABY40_00725 [Nanoarchaeota archaeon]